MAVTVTVRTAPGLSASNAEHELAWDVQPGKPWTESVPALLDQLKRSVWEKHEDDKDKMTLVEGDIIEYVHLSSAPKEEGVDGVGPAGEYALLDWKGVAPEKEELEKMIFECKEVPNPDDPEGLEPEPEPEPTLDEPPPDLEVGPYVQDMGTSANDVPKYNEVMVTGTLPMQHLKVSALSWKPTAMKASEGLMARPVSTATMCPSCGTPFAMSITKDHTKDRMLTPAMESELNSALEAQRAVLEGERDTLEAEVTDLRAALNSINASLSRTREDGEELGQLKGQQDEWGRWLEDEVRQTKAEIAQVSYDFDQCLRSNANLEQALELAIHRKVEERYYPERQPKNAPVHSPVATLPRPLPSPSAGRPSVPRSASPTHSPVAPHASKKARLRDIVAQYYNRHNPAKLEFVDALVDEYQGRERDLLNLMARKYGDVSILGYDPVIDGQPGGRDLPPQHGAPAPADDNSRMRNLLDSFMPPPPGAGPPRPSRGGYSHPPELERRLPPPSSAYQPGQGGGSRSRPDRVGVNPPSRYAGTAELQQLDDDIRNIAPQAYDRLQRPPAY
eukprot:TRINITY_DN3034_c0_g1_i1.p1 TRINITY_DN3034_c0_g1~~TRINITY_DN3034_c0_g1_i1.p1  ORF type:complete len:583 (+),score=163.32 TRINITY_DN3034_c0_g1_i1:69-1751(+)